MKRFVAASFLALYVHAAYAAEPQNHRPPSIGSGDVAAYLSRRLADPENRADTLDWAEAEAAKIKSASALLYECERHLAEMDWTDQDRVADEVRSVAAAAEVTEQAVRDGAAIALAVSRAKDFRNPPSVQTRLQKSGISAEQRTELRRRGVVGDEAIERYLRREAADAPVRQAAIIRGRARAFQDFQQQQAAREQQILNTWALAQAVNAERQRANGPGPWAGGYAGVPYAGPFYESILDVGGGLTAINGYGPYGPFSETILDLGGGVTAINGSGVPFAPVIVAPHGGPSRHPHAGYGPGY